MATIPETLCVILTPHRSEFDALRQAITGFLMGTDVRIVSEYDQVLPGSSLSTVPETIHRTIQKADLVIADVSGGNPNVMYEVGFAQALRKPVLLIVRDDSHPVPSNLSGQLFFTYDASRPADDKNLEFAVRTWIERHMLALQSR